MGASVLLLGLESTRAPAAIIDVYPGGSIQAAVTAAGIGDTIQAHAGTYAENVTIPGTKNLTLQGDGRDLVYWNGGAATCVSVGGGSPVVDISGFTFTAAGAGHFGIYAGGIKTGTLSFHDNRFFASGNQSGGIWACKSWNVDIYGNIFSPTSPATGILMSRSKSFDIYDNVATGSGFIVMGFSCSTAAETIGGHHIYGNLLQRSTILFHEDAPSAKPVTILPSTIERNLFHNSSVGLDLRMNGDGWADDILNNDFIGDGVGISVTGVAAVTVTAQYAYLSGNTLDSLGPVIFSPTTLLRQTNLYVPEPASLFLLTLVATRLVARRSHA